jgi:hypothetical protein
MAMDQEEKFRTALIQLYKQETNYENAIDARNQYLLLDEIGVSSKEIEALKKNLSENRIRQITREVEKMENVSKVEEELGRAWGHLQMIKAKEDRFSPPFFHEEYGKAQFRINLLIKDLPEGRGDELIKEFEKKRYHKDETSTEKK